MTYESVRSHLEMQETRFVSYFKGLKSGCPAPEPHHSRRKPSQDATLPAPPSAAPDRRVQPGSERGGQENPAGPAQPLPLRGHAIRRQHAENGHRYARLNTRWQIAILSTTDRHYWDSSLEKQAKAYAAECIWDHNPNLGNTGENLYMTSSNTLSMADAMNSWHKERIDYDFATMACTEKKMCGHYTQVVWADSMKIGCGEQFCEKVKKSDRQKQFILVCNYAPAGNYRGQKPYIEGKSCSKCPAETKCINNLCAIQETAPDPSVGWSATLHSTTTAAIQETAPDLSIGWSATLHSTTTAAYSIELEEASTALTTTTHEQPSSPELRTSPEVDLDLEDFSVASVTTEGIPSPKQASTHSLTSAPGVDRDVQETTTLWFTSTDPSSLQTHLISTQVEVEKEKEDRTTLRTAEQMSPQTWPSSQSLFTKDLAIALDDASKKAQRNLSPKLTPSVRIITSPKGNIGMEESYQSDITPEPTLSPVTSSLLHIITTAGSHTLPFLSDPADKTDSAAARNFPASICLWLPSAIFLLKLFF
uniref:Peptidase inhibitor 16-like n=1 Tax=Geotrypetes seraphini TaxID=260995 RepID=A0A6P8NUC4_GEOSA|nr:peptidase inhibitor 16-like [Geotrypetes seraphini]